MASFLDHWLDNDYRQREDIDDARFNGELALQNLETLREAVAKQRQELYELKTTVAVLMRLLDDAKVVPASALRAGVDDQLAARVQAARPENRQVPCAKCRRTVPAIQTEITEDGTLCAACINA
jgi:hypothetical protein